MRKVRCLGTLNPGFHVLPSALWWQLPTCSSYKACGVRASVIFVGFSNKNEGRVHLTLDAFGDLCPLGWLYFRDAYEVSKWLC